MGLQILQQQEEHLTKGFSSLPVAEPNLLPVKAG